MNEYKWNDDWRDAIDDAMLTRLAECHNTAMDVVAMATVMHKVNPLKTAVECFERMVEWVCDWNGQLNVASKIYKDDNSYQWYLSRVA